MKQSIFLLLGVVGLLSFNPADAMPIITGEPKIITPNELLDWPQDIPQSNPYLTEPTANRLNDLHGQIGQCDIVLSTSGSYHMALRDLWQDYFLPTYADSLEIKTWYYTTSSPIPIEQIQNKSVQFGNVAGTCIPQVVVAPGRVMNQLSSLGLSDGDSIPILKDFGNVILIQKGNPKHIRSIWDLGRSDITVATPNPQAEPLVFGNFSGTIYNIAANDAKPPERLTADILFNRIFNSQNHEPAEKNVKSKWVSGKRIAHREIPYLLANGYADAGIMFHHLAVYLSKTFPDKFDWVPLGGSKENPDPLAGNQVTTMMAVRIKGEWSHKQYLTSEALISSLTSEEFTKILLAHSLRRP